MKKNKTPAAVPTNAHIETQLLVDVVRIIDVASRRGAFEGAELLQVGTIREKIAQIVNSIQQPQAAPAPATNQDVATASK